MASIAVPKAFRFIFLGDPEHLENCLKISWKIRRVERQDDLRAASDRGSLGALLGSVAPYSRVRGSKFAEPIPEK
jgi:hypothetical protein